MSQAKTSSVETASSRAALRRQWSEAALTTSRRGFIERQRRQGGDAVRIGVFSSTTWRPIAPFLEGELLIEGLVPALRFFEYGALDAEIAGGGDLFDAAILAADDLESYGGLFRARSPFPEEKSQEALQGILGRVDRLLERAPQVLVLLPPAPPRLPFPLDWTPDGEALSGRILRFSRELLSALSARPGVVAIDGEAALADLGRTAARDRRLWEIGRVPYTEAGFLALARALAPPLLLKAGRGIKAVVVDLDNTLWGGLAGEGGIPGVDLGEGYPGSAFIEMQEELRIWKESGLLLAVASKNNRADALAVLDGHPRMLLSSRDFDHLEIGWHSKAESVGRIIETFRISSGAVLFIDDNAREREEVERAFPEIRILDLPGDPMGYVEALRRIPWPLFAGSTEEDGRRGDLQRQERERRSAAGAAASREDYLRSLDIEVSVSIDDPADVARIAQLHQKTNQFNLDPVRYGEPEIAAAMASPLRSVIGLRYRDRFGDAGLIGAAVVDCEGETPRVETFLLSCRIIGLGVEEVLLGEIVRAAPEGATAIRLPYRPTEKNEPARKFLESLTGVEPAVPGVVIPIERLAQIPAWIRLYPAPAASPREMETLHAS